MASTDKRIDAYINKSANFAQPILSHLRKLIHKACPDVTETIKWGMPSFEYKGLLCNMAAFKQHAVFGFWKSKLIDDPGNHLQERHADGGDAMGNLGRITSKKDLPTDKVIISLIKQAVKLNDENVKLPPPTRKATQELVVPDYFLVALKKNKKALSTWNNFNHYNKKEYLEWIIEAKREETRTKRIGTTLQWLEEGKIRNWKYI
jgi:hypothetical protein